MNTENSTVVAIAGKNNIAVEVLEYVTTKYKDAINILAICNRTEKGTDTWQKSFRKYVQQTGVPEVELEALYGIKNLIFISLEFDRIIKPHLFSTKWLFNIHFSLLPKYKGVYTSVFPILNGETEGGVTLHKIDCGIDTGDIIMQRKFKLSSRETARSLYFKYIDAGTILMKQNIDQLILNPQDAVAYCQDMEESTYYSKKSIDYSNIKIDLLQTAQMIDRQIRAFSFREYQMPLVYDMPVIAASITTVKSMQKPGTVLFRTEQGMLLSTIDYNIILYFDRFGELLESCRSGNISKVREIITVKEHINQVDEHGRTPLITATCYNHPDIVELLMMQGADLFVQDYYGKNSLMYAEEAGDESLCRLFLNIGRDHAGVGGFYGGL